MALALALSHRQVDYSELKSAHPSELSASWLVVQLFGSSRYGVVLDCCSSGEYNLEA